jgi:tRNA threonylcarbamoyladenosine modification (KEOPS) complex  Pcc1 subunit
VNKHFKQIEFKAIEFLKRNKVLVSKYKYLLSFYVFAHTMLRAKYILDLEDLDQIYLALIPELSGSPTYPQRSRVAISKKCGKLMISMEADDLSSFRAAMNTWLGLVSVAANMENILSKEHVTIKMNKNKKIDFD